MTVSVHLQRGAKEPHNKELYCVAWSTDMHIGYEYDFECLDQAYNEVEDGSEFNDARAQNENVNGAQDHYHQNNKLHVRDGYAENIESDINGQGVLHHSDTKQPEHLGSMSVSMYSVTEDIEATAIAKQRHPIRTVSAECDGYNDQQFMNERKRSMRNEESAGLSESVHWRTEKGKGTTAIVEHIHATSTKSDNNCDTDNHQRVMNGNKRARLNDESANTRENVKAEIDITSNDLERHTGRSSSRLKDDDSDNSVPSRKQSSGSSDEGSSVSMPNMDPGPTSRLSDDISEEESDRIVDADEYNYESDDVDESEEEYEREQREGTRKSKRLIGMSTEDEAKNRRILRSMLAKEIPESIESSMLLREKKSLDRNTANGKNNATRSHDDRKNSVSYTIDKNHCIVIDESDSSDENNSSDDGSTSGDSEAIIDDEDSSIIIQSDKIDNVDNENEDVDNNDNEHENVDNVDNEHEDVQVDDTNHDDGNGHEKANCQVESSDSSCQIVDIQSPKINPSEVPEVQRELPKSSKCMPRSSPSPPASSFKDKGVQIQQECPPAFVRPQRQQQKGDLCHWYTMATCGGRYLTIYQVQSDKVSQGTAKSDTSSMNGHWKGSKGNCNGYKSSSVGTRSISPFNGESDIDMSGSMSSSNPLTTDFNKDFQVRQIYRDVDEEEGHYTLIFAGRSRHKLHHVNDERTNSIRCFDLSVMGIETKENGDMPGSGRRDTSSLPRNVDDLDSNAPQLCCVGGKRGIIKVIDTVQQCLIFTLIGHTNDIYDLKACPSNEWLLLSASNDETVRLWNLKVPTCIAIFAGHHGHREAVLSIDWHPLGQEFVSSGMDGMIKIWTCQENNVQKAIQDSFSSANQAVAVVGGAERSKFPTVTCQLPIFSTTKLHTDFVDCVQYCGDLILSKSSNVVSLWKPELSKTDCNSNNSRSNGPFKVSIKDSENFIHLQNYNVTACESWYVRFGTDMECKMLAVGNCLGGIRLWEIGGAKKYQNVHNPNCSATVRMVSFSPDGRIMMAVTDDSHVWKFDVRSDTKKYTS